MTPTTLKDVTSPARGKSVQRATKPQRAIRFIDLDTMTLVAVFSAYDPNDYHSKQHRHRVTLDFNSGRCKCDCQGRVHTDPALNLFAYFEMGKPCRHIRLAVEWAEKRMGWLVRTSQGAYVRSDGRQPYSFYQWIQSDLTSSGIDLPWYSFGENGGEA